MQRKRISRALCVLLMMLTISSMPVVANDPLGENQIPDIGTALVAEESEKLGSVTIMLEDTKYERPKENVVFNVTKIADVENGEFVLDEAYEELNINLNTIKTASEMEEVCEILKPIASEGLKTVTDKNGIAIVKNLPVGVYFIHATDIADYEYISSFLVSVPTWNEVEKRMEYDVDTIPKHAEIIGTIKTEIPRDFAEGVHTGDATDVLIWMILFVIALFVIFAMGRRKKNN